jgi:hypothetical protein
VGRAGGDIRIIEPLSARSVFVTECPRPSDRRLAVGPPMPCADSWRYLMRARAPVMTPVLLNNHDPRAAAGIPASG